jgi:hypothetical protein
VSSAPDADGKRPAGTPFIPAALDDAGLTAPQFRVFCRIARRSNGGDASCFESVPNIAKAVRLEEKTVRAAIDALETRRMVAIHQRIGFPNHVSTLPEDQWLAADTLPNRHQTPKALPPPADECPTPGADYRPTPGAFSPTLPERPYHPPGAFSPSPTQKALDEGPKKVPKEVTNRSSQGEGGVRTAGATGTIISHRDIPVEDRRDHIRKLLREAEQAGVEWVGSIDHAWCGNLHRRGYLSAVCQRNTQWRNDLAAFFQSFLTSLGGQLVGKPRRINTAGIRDAAVRLLTQQTGDEAMARTLFDRWKSDAFGLRHGLSLHPHWQDDLAAFVARQTASVEPAPIAPAMPDIPAELLTPEFERVWNEWVAYRRRLKRPGSWATMFTKQLESLATFGPLVAIATLNASMTNGWTGLFPEKIYTRPGSQPGLRGTSTPAENGF